MPILNESYTLSDGRTIPKIGFGTWQIADADAPRAVGLALKNGYRHIDTAHAYGNETGVGTAIRESGLKREELFITTKIHGAIKTYEGAKRSIEESLSRLNIGYVDLLLIHWPRPDDQSDYFEENLAVWQAMTEAWQKSLVRSLGVSNFDIPDLENIAKHTIAPITVNQIKYHIGYTQNKIVNYGARHGILTEGFSPIATGALLQNEKIAEVANKYGVTLPQLCIRYLLEKDILPLPKSTHETYIIENTAVDFSIEREDLLMLDRLKL